MDRKIKISTVIPVYKGEVYLEKLVMALLSVRDKWSNSDTPIELVEAIFVNDSAVDTSSIILQRLQQKFSWIQLITLSKNYGQHPATVAGILHSSGDWVFTIDEDLQHDPQYFDLLLEHAVKHEADVVYAKPESTVHQSAMRDLTSRTYKYFLSKITANPHISSFNSYRLIRGAIARSSASVCSHATYFDIALCWFTDRFATLSIPLKDHRYIESKMSGYTIMKLLSHARRLLISAPAKILRVGALAGIFALISSLIYGAFIFYKVIFDPSAIEAKGWTSTILTILFLGGLCSLLLGVIIEYITNILLHSQGKPSFFVIDRSSDTLIRTYYEIKGKIL